MKLLIPLLSLILAHVALAAEDPAALIELRQAWEEVRGTKQQRVDKLYFAELEELKKNFTKAGNVADAMAVDNEIKGGKKGDKEPAMLIKTRQARDNSLGKALKSLDKKYWQDLKKLKAEFQQQGNLAGVVATDTEIEKVLAAYNKLNPSKHKPRALDSTKVDHQIVGKWEFDHKGKKRYFEFKSDSRFTGQFLKDGSKFSGKWRVNGEKIVLWDNKRKEEMRHHLEIVSDDTLMFFGPAGHMTGSRK